MTTLTTPVATTDTLELENTPEAVPLMEAEEKISNYCYLVTMAPVLQLLKILLLKIIYLTLMKMVVQ